jgi:DNA (cytosine-5)-methyltransferase 1
MLRIIKELQPDWVLGENVANFIRMELDNAIVDLEIAGYEVGVFNIPAVGVGAWHKRERCFIVAHSRHDAGSTEQIMQSNISEEPITSSTGSICPESPANSERIERSQLRDIPGMGWGMEYDPWDGSCLWKSEPDVGRVVDGVPKGLDEFRRQRRCHALGNAVVPQQVYPILKAIADIERGLI